MFLRKIASSLFFRKTRVWLVWLAFTLLIFSLSRLMLSLELIKIQGPSKFDIFLELGFYYLLSFTEALILSLMLGGLQIGVEKVIHKDLDLLVQIILVSILTIPFINITLALFKLPSL